MKMIGVFVGIVLAGATGHVAAAEPFVKKSLDGACLPMSHPEFYETKIYVRKNTMQECVASGGKEEHEPPPDEDGEVQAASSGGSAVNG
ncbi:MAG: hypothetical protein QF921_06925 [Pseudomonadales bacterium]|nr:hypothetical protein [Pseudomonadales bacterium]MDP6971235.1 hypothetical protein [Pseudomonadales bacterium]